ncbi:4Fe-4S binding protein [Methylocystis parvus]|uniref:4Fe-4S binding protein n=1 Tax=Methylocystis parvus TaxID=134 RepID=UPI003C77F14F
MLAAILIAASAPAGATTLRDYLGRADLSTLVPGAERLGPPAGEPPIAPALSGDKTVGYVYLNTDFAESTGYSGKPIRLLVGLGAGGVLTGFQLVEHKEPIVLVGIPEKRIVAAVNRLIGTDLSKIASGAATAPQVDIVSGATVTVLVIGDSIVRSATRLIHSGRLAAVQGQTAAPAEKAPAKINPDVTQTLDWNALLAEGAVAQLRLTVGALNEAFAKANPKAATAPEAGAPDDVFIDLYAALVSVPAIGRSLLGEEEYRRLAERLRPGQGAILVAANGLYSFKGSAYVRGGIFDRFEILQHGSGFRFRDKNHQRLGALAADGAPGFNEIGLFVASPETDFDPTEPWRLQLLVQRAVGEDKFIVIEDLNYRLPEKYLVRQAPVPQAAQAPAPAPEAAPLWERMWRGNVGEIAITVAALVALTGIFFFQNHLVRRPALYARIRGAYLIFTLVWLGWWANAQLSVVNVLTFSNALLTGFNWTYFLTAPLVFILWSAMAVALLFWGRGPFCGWLCPFGALQELTNHAAQRLKVPQYRVPWGLHERLWPIKYIIFVGLFGLSLSSLASAEQLAEVEPFKTAIVLKFMRSWPFVLYAVSLLVAGLFIERFFCRYLCPLGAALAIPGRIRMFEWLRRWPECGSPCQRCAAECPVQSIHPEGHINVNECIYCMHCQELYFDDQRCPHMIQLRLKREKREALSSPSMRR